MTVESPYQQIEFSLLGEPCNYLRGRSDIVNKDCLQRLRLEKRTDWPDHGLGVIVVVALDRRLAGESESPRVPWRLFGLSQATTVAA